MHDAVVALLVEKGADVGARLADGCTVLFLASAAGYHTIVEHLQDVLRGSTVPGADAVTFPIVRSVRAQLAAGYAYSDGEVRRAGGYRDVRLLLSFPSMAPAAHEHRLEAQGPLLQALPFSLQQSEPPGSRVACPGSRPPAREQRP